MFSNAFAIYGYLMSITVISGMAFVGLTNNVPQVSIDSAMLTIFICAIINISSFSYLVSKFTRGSNSGNEAK
jgi:hypothetical protein